MSKINELIQSSDGLTEDFKKAIPEIFEEAVKKAVKKEEEGDVEDAEKSEVCPECGKDPCVCEEDDKDKKEVCEEGEEGCDDEKIGKKADEALKEAARKIVELDSALKEAAERIVALESQVSESAKEYAENLEILQDNMSELVEARVAERTQEIEENLDLYMDYVAKELTEQYREQVVDQTAVKMAADFMESLGSVYARYNIESPSQAKLQDQKIVELEAKLEESNAKITEVLKDARELAEQVCDYKRIEIVNEKVAGMTDLDKSRFFKLCATLSEERDINTFKSKVEELMEGFKCSEDTATSASTPVITEGLEVQPKNPQVVYDPIKALAASMERMY